MQLSFSLWNNSESIISHEFLDTQVIKSLCATQLVYPWIHLNFLFMCVSNMTDFYQNMDDIHSTLSAWVHIDVPVLHCFLSDTFFSRKCLLMLYHQRLWKGNRQFSDEISWNTTTISSLLSFIFNVLTIFYIFSRTLIFF